MLPHNYGMLGGQQQPQPPQPHPQQVQPHHPPITTSGSYSDSGNSNSRGSDPTKKNKNGDVTKFPARLHYVLLSLVKEGIADDIISWTPDGKAFRIHNKDRLEKEILPNWFRQRKFSSFQRQLNNYGIKRFTSGKYKGCYGHPNFLRDRPDLAMYVERPSSSPPAAAAAAVAMAIPLPAAHPNHRNLPGPPQQPTTGPPNYYNPAVTTATLAASLLRRAEQQSQHDISTRSSTSSSFLPAAANATAVSAAAHPPPLSLQTFAAQISIADTAPVPLLPPHLRYSDGDSRSSGVPPLNQEDLMIIRCRIQQQIQHQRQLAEIVRRRSLQLQQQQQQQQQQQRSPASDEKQQQAPYLQSPLVSSPKTNSY